MRKRTRSSDSGGRTRKRASRSRSATRNGAGGTATSSLVASLEENRSNIGFFHYEKTNLSVVIE